MNPKSKEIILKDIIRRLQTAVELALENGEIPNDIKSWIDGILDAVRADINSIEKEEEKSHQQSNY